MSELDPLETAFRERLQDPNHLAHVMECERGCAGIGNLAALPQLVKVALEHRRQCAINGPCNTERINEPRGYPCDDPLCLAVRALGLAYDYGSKT